MDKIKFFDQFVNESVDYLDVTIYEAKDGKWYLYVMNTQGFDPSHTLYGPFGSKERAIRRMDREYPNPGGWAELKDQEVPEKTGRLDSMPALDYSKY